MALATLVPRGVGAITRMGLSAGAAQGQGPPGQLGPAGKGQGPVSTLLRGVSPVRVMAPTPRGTSVASAMSPRAGEERAAPPPQRDNSSALSTSGPSVVTGSSTPKAPLAPPPAAAPAGAPALKKMSLPSPPVLET